MPDPDSEQSANAAKSDLSPSSLPSTLFDHHDSSSRSNSTANSQESTVKYAPTHPSKEQPIIDKTESASSTQNEAPSDMTLPDAPSEPPRNPSADANFLLRILSLGAEIDHASVSDLHNCPTISKPLLSRTITSLTELHLSPDVICLGAALIPRACSLRLASPIFPLDSPWYEEEETPLATLAVALRVAQLWLEGEMRLSVEWYAAWGFYPFEDLVRFARILGDPAKKAPVASVEWERWCELMRNFEKSLVDGVEHE